jgi:uncharacterized protein (TIGR02453 family)
MQLNKKILGFLKELALNNNKTWYNDHKDHYKVLKTEFHDWLTQVAAVIAMFDSRVRDHLDHKKTIKVFRLQRDTRFSKGKDPYKLNFGGTISAGGMEAGYPGYYLHIEPGNCFIAGGLYMPPKEKLAAIRDKMLANPKKIRTILADKKLQKTFGGLSTDGDLKTAPRGYDKEDPNVDLLRHKHFILYKSLKDAEVFKPDFMKQALDMYKTMEPLNEYLAKA